MPKIKFAHWEHLPVLLDMKARRAVLFDGTGRWVAWPWIDATAKAALLDRATFKRMFPDLL